MAVISRFSKLSKLSVKPLFETAPDEAGKSSAGDGGDGHFCETDELPGDSLGLSRANAGLSLVTNPGECSLRADNAADVRGGGMLVRKLPVMYLSKYAEEDAFRIGGESGGTVVEPRTRIEDSIGGEFSESCDEELHLWHNVRFLALKSNSCCT